MAGAVTINTPTLDARCEKAAEKWGKKVGRAVVKAAKKRCPVDEGTLRESIDYTVTTGNGAATVTVGSPLDYAAYVHRGTGIYGPSGQPIRPTQAKVLAFQWEPKSFTASGRQRRRKSKDKRNQHFYPEVAGSPAVPFLADGLEDVFGVLAQRFTP